MENLNLPLFQTFVLQFQLTGSQAILSYNLIQALCMIIMQQTIIQAWQMFIITSYLSYLI